MFKKSEKGLTLVEIIVSIAILGMIAVSIIPMFTFAVKNARNNSTKLTAMNLAYSQVEWVKSLNYDDIGLTETGYPVKGIVNGKLYMNQAGTETKTIDGIEYSVRTSIYWDGDISITKEPVPKARKKIDVYVETLNPITRKTNEYSILETLITFEGERDPTIPGHMNVFAYYQSSTSKPLQNVKIETKTELGASKGVVYTDRDGKATVVDLEKGYYLVKPTSYSKISNFMTRPEGVTTNKKDWVVEKNIEVPKWDKNNPPTYPTHEFLLDYPAKIEFVQESGEDYPSDLVIPIYPGGTYIPKEPMTIDDITLKPRLDEISNKSFWRLWQYSWGTDKTLGYKDSSGRDHKFYITQDQKEWDGIFDTREESTVKKELKICFGLEEKNTKIGINKDNVIAEVVGNQFRKIKFEFTSTLKLNELNYKEVETFEVRQYKKVGETKVYTTDADQWLEIPIPKDMEVTRDGKNVVIPTYTVKTDNNKNFTIEFIEEFQDESIIKDPYSTGMEFRISEKKVRNNPIKNIYGMKMTSDDKRNNADLELK